MTEKRHLPHLTLVHRALCRPGKLHLTKDVSAVTCERCLKLNDIATLTKVDLRIIVSESNYWEIRKDDKPIASGDFNEEGETLVKFTDSDGSNDLYFLLVEAVLNGQL